MALEGVTLCGAVVCVCLDRHPTFPPTTTHMPHTPFPHMHTHMRSQLHSQTPPPSTHAHTHTHTHTHTRTHTHAHTQATRILKPPLPPY